MLELRDHVAVAKPEDLPALFEQMHHLGALQAQRGRGISGSVDRASPYFGHMSLQEQVAYSGRAGGSARGKPTIRRRDGVIASPSPVPRGGGVPIRELGRPTLSRRLHPP